jgi:hypothetical protein
MLLEVLQIVLEDVSLNFGVKEAPGLKLVIQVRTGLVSSGSTSCHVAATAATTKACRTSGSKAVSGCLCAMRQRAEIGSGPAYCRSQKEAVGL